MAARYATALCLFCYFTAVSVAAEQPDIPSVQGPVPDTSESHAFLASAHLVQPFDLTGAGYLEEEYLISGSARLYEWGDVGALATSVAGSYTTRILVRRPRNAESFSGTVIVEPMNPSSPVDLPIMWAQSYRQFVADGHAWVGITIKPNTIASLRRFDPARYGELALPHPAGGPECSAEDINAWSQPTTRQDETGLAWDIISQVGALLKGEGAEAILGRTAERLYMTGQSQTAGYARTYATFFARNVTDSAGDPLFDAYLYSGSPPWHVPLHQCASDLPEADPRLLTGAAGVPVIEIFAEGDIGTNIASRRPDSDTAADLYRRYEVAGAPHVDPWEQLSFASAADMIRATGAPERSGEVCEPEGVEPSDFPVRHGFNAAWRALDAWVRTGEPAPRAAPLQLKAEIAQPFQPEDAFVTDEHGNALGGVRNPAIDVPTTRWIGSKTPAFRCMFEGYQYPFDAAQLEVLYGDVSGYRARVRESASQLQNEGWLTPEDVEEILAAAQAFEFP